MTKAQETKQASTQRAFAAACQDLRSALDAQHHPAVGPSLNVEKCIYRVLAFGGDFGKRLGENLRVAVIDSLTVTED